MVQKTFAVSGMKCPHCKAKVEDACAPWLAFSRPRSIFPPPA